MKSIQEAGNLASELAEDLRRTDLTRELEDLADAWITWRRLQAAMEPGRLVGLREDA